MSRISGDFPDNAPAPCFSHRAHPAAAFSLIEVLIGILILALGLLGLGAIIPVVVREQRAASDATLGIAAAEDAEHLLATRVDYYVPNPAAPDIRFPVRWWEPWLRDPNWSPAQPGGANGQYAYLWAPWNSGSNNNEMDVDPSTGAGRVTGSYAFFNGGTGNSGQHNLLYPVAAEISLRQRLWPSGSRQGPELTAQGTDPYRPIFVWDIVGRRVPPPADQLDSFTDRLALAASGNPGDLPALLESRSRLQVAVFVRRIDLGIRVPQVSLTVTTSAGTGSRSATLYDVLTLRANPIAASDYRVPVAVAPPGQSENALGTGEPPGVNRSYLPTNTGTSPLGLYYSGPLMVAPTFYPDERDRFTFSGLNSNDSRFRLLSQPGQRLVDNLGNVYTVLGVPDQPSSAHPTGDPAVLVDPPIPAWVPAQNTSSPSSQFTKNPYTIRQLVFMPQIPAAVKVFTINPAAQ